MWWRVFWGGRTHSKWSQGRSQTKADSEDPDDKNLKVLEYLIRNREARSLSYGQVYEKGIEREIGHVPSTHWVFSRSRHLDRG